MSDTPTTRRVPRDDWDQIDELEIELHNLKRMFAAAIVAAGGEITIPNGVLVAIRNDCQIERFEYLDGVRVSVR